MPLRFTVPLTSSLARPRSADAEGRELRAARPQSRPAARRSSQAAQRGERRRSRRAHLRGALARVVARACSRRQEAASGASQELAAVMRVRPSCCSSSTSSQPSPGGEDESVRTGRRHGPVDRVGRARSACGARQLGDRADVRRERPHLVGDRRGGPAPVDLLVARVRSWRRTWARRPAGRHSALPAAMASERRATPSTAGGARSSYARPASASRGTWTSRASPTGPSSTPARHAAGRRRPARSRRP